MISHNDERLTKAAPVPCTCGWQSRRKAPARRWEKLAPGRGCCIAARALRWETVSKKSPGPRRWQGPGRNGNAAGQGIPDRQRLQPGAELFDESGLELLLRQGALDGGHFEDGAEHAGQQPVAEEHAVVEDEVLQAAALGGHDHGAVRGVERRDGAFRTGDEHGGAVIAAARTDAAAQADLGVEVQPVRTVRVFDHGQGIDGAEPGAAPALDALLLIDGDDEVGVDGLGHLEALDRGEGLAAAAAAVADEVDALADVLAELHEIVLPGLVQQFQAFALAHLA